MIRPFTLISMVLAMVSGAYLFGVKHRAQVLDDQLAAVAQASRLDQQRIRVLQAQWALEIDPNRLQRLAAQFSPLQPMKPAQLVSLAALGEMLPPAGSAAPAGAAAVPLIAGNDAVGTDAAGGLAATGATVVAVARVAMLPMPPPMPPAGAPPASAVSDVPATLAVTRHAVPSPAALRTLLAAKNPARNVRLASVARRDDGSHLAPGEWAANLAPSRPMEGAQVMSVSTAPTAVASESQGGSMLGMAADLAPPQPVSQGVGN